MRESARKLVRAGTDICRGRARAGRGDGAGRRTGSQSEAYRTGRESDECACDVHNAAHGCATALRSAIPAGPPCRPRRCPSRRARPIRGRGASRSWLACPIHGPIRRPAVRPPRRAPSLIASIRRLRRRHRRPPHRCARPGRERCHPWHAPGPGRCPILALPHPFRRPRVRLVRLVRRLEGVVAGCRWMPTCQHGCLSGLATGKRLVVRRRRQRMPGRRLRRRSRAGRASRPTRVRRGRNRRPPSASGMRPRRRDGAVRPPPRARRWERPDPRGCRGRGGAQVPTSCHHHRRHPRPHGIVRPPRPPNLWAARGPAWRRSAVACRASAGGVCPSGGARRPARGQARRRPMVGPRVGRCFRAGWHAAERSRPADPAGVSSRRSTNRTRRPPAIWRRPPRRVDPIPAWR